MSIAFAQIVVPVNRAREAIDGVFKLILDLADKAGAVPCGYLEAYSALRQRQLRVETLIREAARAMNVHPPEDMPRSFALVGSCAPGEQVLKLDPAFRKAGREYLADVAKRRAQVDQMLAQAYQTNTGFRQIADAGLSQLASVARANSEETLPPPRNVGLLKLFYLIGGTPWGVLETDEFRRQGMVEHVEGAEVMKILQDTSLLAQSITNALASAKPLVVEKKKGIPWWAIALGVIGLGGAGYAIHRVVKARHRAAFLHDIEEALEDSDDEEDADVLGTPTRRRKRRRKALPAKREAR